MISIRDRELEDTRMNLEQAKQMFYDIGFNDAECSIIAMIKKAKLKRLHGGLYGSC